MVDGAQLKLESFSIWHYFRLGAYGSDHHDRNVLVPIAQQRAHALLGHTIPAQQTFVIGDTPRDIACGKAFRARTIAIATGSVPREKLAAHEPDFLFDDLSNVDEVIKTLNW